MFESHFGLRENPFSSGHQSRFVYPSHEHQEALAHLRYGIENLEPFVLITGEVGTGKTTALFEALAELQARVSVALITNSALTRGELLEEICLRFGIAVTPPVTKPQAMTRLEQHLLALRGRGERAILLLDEAQNFDRELLEEIRLLSNLEASGEKLVQIILVGQPELEAKLTLPELRQLRQRISVHYRLHPLSLEDTERYIQHRVGVAGGDAPRVFPPETCSAVHAVTNGIPREINQVCAQAMLDAYVEGVPGVSPGHVFSAATETTFQSVLPTSDADPRLAPLPAWPAAVPPPAFAAPPPSVAAPPSPLAAPPPPPAAPAPLPEAPQTVADAGQWAAWASSLAQPPESAEVAPEPPAPPAPILEQVERIEVPREPEPTPPQAGPGTRYAAESALEPPSSAAPLHMPGRPTSPSRLYDRMRDAQPEPPSNAGIKLLIGLAVAAVVVIGAILLFRFGPWAKPELPVSPITTTLPADTLRTAPGDSSAALQAVDSTLTDTSVTMAPTSATPGTSVPVPAPVTPPRAAAIARPVVAAPAAAPVTVQEFGLSVGTYLDRARAESELARIGGASGLTGRLTEVRREGTTMYAVVIGAFPNRDAAERKASELVSNGAVDEARVFPRTVRARP